VRTAQPTQRGRQLVHDRRPALAAAANLMILHPLRQPLEVVGARHCENHPAKELPRSQISLTTLFSTPSRVVSSHRFVQDVVAVAYDHAAAELMPTRIDPKCYTMRCQVTWSARFWWVNAVSASGQRRQDFCINLVQHCSADNQIGNVTSRVSC
jgi:hypothetical protein